MLSLPACASDADRRAEGTESSTVRVISQAPAPVPPRATNGPGATNGPDANSAPSAEATATDSGADAPQGTGPEASDVPLVAGRLGFVRGAVEVWDPQSNGWRAAVLNETIGPRSALRTGADGRTEVSVGTSTLRLDGDSEVSWQRLDEERAEVEFDRGTMIVSRRSELGRPPPGASWAPESGSATPAQAGLVPIVVAVDAVSVTLSGPGSARVVHDAASRRLTVIASSGRAEVEHAGTRTALAAGQALALDTGSGAQVAATNTAGTEFESWSFERDRKASGSASYRYVSPAMTGAEVLDEHGRWQVDDSYGPIWYPTVVPASWAPYRVGQWSWVAPWGWTWVDEAPWGYAPFHYGRWAYVGNRWGWVPGALGPAAGLRAGLGRVLRRRRDRQRQCRRPAGNRLVPAGTVRAVVPRVPVFAALLRRRQSAHRIPAGARAELPARLPARWATPPVPLRRFAGGRDAGLGAALQRRQSDAQPHPDDRR